MESYRRGPLSVLFVEDEPDIRAIVQLAFAMDPSIALTTYDAPLDALAAFDADPKPYDVALFNVQLPAMTGIMLMRQLRLRPAFGDTPVVFITASVHAEDLREHIAAGARGTISKPFNPLDLTDRLRTIMAGG